MVEPIAFPADSDLVRACANYWMNWKSAARSANRSRCSSREAWRSTYTPRRAPRLDLVVSKIARYRGPDPEDIAGLIAHFNITADEIEARALQALGSYVGNVDHLRMNLRDVLAMARKRHLQCP